MARFAERTPLLYARDENEEAIILIIQALYLHVALISHVSAYHSIRIIQVTQRNERTRK